MPGMAKTENETSSTSVGTIRTTTSHPLRRTQLPQVNSTVLYEGPRARREIVHYPIHSGNTGAFKGNQIGFRTSHKVAGVWQKEPSKSFTLEGDAQIAAAVQFMQAACAGSMPDSSGDFLVVPAAKGLDASAVQRGLNELSAAGQTDVLTGLLHRLTHERSAAVELLRRVAADPDAYAGAAAMLTYGRYRQALNRLAKLVEQGCKEQELQTLLSANPWMFGAEYSENLSGHRALTRDTQQDFVLRRTADGYIEVVEIKTPLPGVDLFRFDKSRSSHYAGPELSAAVGQVERYIEELEADRHAILARDGIDTLKVRAKVIIGHDGDEGQRTALRRHNGHLHRVEVLTFDQLIAIARRTTDHLFAAAKSSREGADR